MLVRFLDWFRRCQKMIENHMSDLYRHRRVQRTLTLIFGYDWLFYGIYLDPTGKALQSAFTLLDGFEVTKQVPRNTEFLNTYDHSGPCPTLRGFAAAEVLPLLIH